MSRSKKKIVEKFHYSPSEIVYSPGWCTEDFRSADKQRELDRIRTKTQNADNLGQLLQLIEDEQICSFHVFMKLVYTHHPNFRECAIQNHSLLRDVIRDKRYDVSCGFSDMNYKQVCNELKAQRSLCSEQDEKISELWMTISQLTGEKYKVEEKILELQTHLEEAQRFSKYLIEKNTQLQELLEFEEIKL